MPALNLNKCIQSDLHRHGKKGFKQLILHILFHKEFKVVFWFRLANHGYRNKSIWFPFVWLKYRLVCKKYNIDLSYKAKIGYGLRLQHVFGIVVNGYCVIGNNCTLSQGVTLGDEKGYSPTVGDKVLFAPGSIAFGNIIVGNGVVVGANCVVNKDVPANTVVVGGKMNILYRPYADNQNRNYFSA
jgi:serine O-acetyltransferase